MTSARSLSVSKGSRLSAATALEKDDAKKSYPTVKAIAVLELLATVRRPLGVSEIGILLHIPKPTAYRIIRMLEGEGLLQREPASKRYVPGTRMVQLGLGVISAAMTNAPRHAILERLSRKIGETCNFGVMANGHVVYLDRVESAWPFGLRFEPGSRVPLHCTSMGKLFLSQFPEGKRKQVLRSIPLDAYTDKTITDVKRLSQELDRIAKRGISTDNQEFLAGVVCVAVPVHDKEKRPVAAIAVSAPLARMTVERALGTAPLLRAAAAELSRTFIPDANGKSNAEDGSDFEL